MPTVGGLAMDGGMYGTEGQSAPRSDGCRALWAAVIMVALQDAIRGPAPSDAALPVDRANAVSFLTDRAGAWAEARELVADAAGVDPDALRDAATAVLSGERAAFDILAKRRGPDLAPRARPTRLKEDA